MKILDHGYLKLVETWGSDERIIESARMSTNKGFLGWGPVHTDDCDVVIESHGFPCTCTPKAGDEKLLRYLYENKHSTPFEMAGFTIEVQAPIMAFREWQRHRTQGYSELSARYAALPDMNYVPTVDRLMINAGGTNKQAGTIEGAEVLTLDAALEWLAELADVYEHAERVYQSGLKRGVPKELARLPVPVARYSRMRATANLRNWLGFMTLRQDSKAQWEIQCYANVVASLIQRSFPRTYDLFVAGRK